MAVTTIQKIDSSTEIDLSPFRRRIWLLRAWNSAALGASAGVVVVILILLGDWMNWWDQQPWWLILSVALGTALGVASAFAKRISDASIARSVDYRARLQDRLTTVFEMDNLGGFAGSLRMDAAEHFRGLSPSKLYPIKFGRPHLFLSLLIVLAAGTYIAFDTPFLKSDAERRDVAAMKADSTLVHAIAKPLLEQSEQPGATPEQKELAKQLNQFAEDLAKGHMSKEEALVKANQLAAEAQQLQANRNQSLAMAVDQAKSAGDRLAEMEQNSSLQPTDQAKLADQAASLQQQMSALQQKIDSAEAQKSGVSPAQLAAMKAQMSSLQKQYQTIQLSLRAQQMLAELASNPDYQKAQELLRRLQNEEELQQIENGTSGNPQAAQQLTQQQLQAMADQLDQLAKQLDTDAKLKAYAKMLREAAEQARLENGAGMSQQLQAAFGLGGGQSLGNEKGPGLPGNGVWLGKTGELNISDKSSLLHVKFQDRVITSQLGKTGSESYTEMLGPSQLNGSSGIPYQAVLPKYEDSAESALSKGEVPPQERTTVKNYFDSLRNP